MARLRGNDGVELGVGTQRGVSHPPLWIVD